MELVDVLFNARPVSPLLPSLLCLTFARLDPAVIQKLRVLLPKSVPNFLHCLLKLMDVLFDAGPASLSLPPCFA